MLLLLEPGYAKRYLVLTREGDLTYSLSPDKPTRDSIVVPHASVTTSKRHGTIHVDSGSTTFREHCAWQRGRIRGTNICLVGKVLTVHVWISLDRLQDVGLGRLWGVGLAFAVFHP